jgi:uncharacterized protein YbcI
MADSAPTADGNSPTALISQFVVRTFSAYTGRGPTQAHTLIDTNLVTVVLRETLTKGERKLAAEGRTQVVLDVRREYQDAMRAELIAGVEQLTGRTVLAFLSANSLEPDVAVETFLLVPERA